MNQLLLAVHVLISIEEEDIDFFEELLGLASGLEETGFNLVERSLLRFPSTFLAFTMKRENFSLRRSIMSWSALAKSLAIANLVFKASSWDSTYFNLVSISPRDFLESSIDCSSVSLALVASTKSCSSLGCSDCAFWGSELAFSNSLAQN